MSSAMLSAITPRKMAGPWAILGAIGLYLFWGVLLIAQQPGLQYDEALLVAGGVHLLHSRAEIDLPHDPHSWLCLHNHYDCLPLMAEGRYIGPVKEYLSVPLFAVFGPRTSVIRLTSMLLGMVGLWGIWMLVAQQAGYGAAAAAALVLAMNPAYVNMTVFDNGAVGGMMAALGLVCAAVACYIGRRSVAAAFWIGAAAGFGIWTRANFIWTLAAIGLAALIAFRRQLLLPPKHLAAVAGGGIVGGLPFLIYQVTSRGGTWQALDMFTAQESLPKLMLSRLYLLAETLLSDREHRAMWGMLEMSAWQRWMFAGIVAAACVVCIAVRRARDQRRWPFAQAAALSFVFLGGFLFLSRLEVAEHHLIAMVPLAVVTVVLACAALQAKHGRAWVVSASLATIYLGSALYWHAAEIRGLRQTRGVGVWSDAVYTLANYLELHDPHREVRIIDWGFGDNLYVVSNGRITPREIGGYHLPWSEEIRRGGVFVISGPGNRQVAEPVNEFLKALASDRPIAHLHTVTQRDGETYAQVVEIEPNSIRGPAAPTQTLSSSVMMSDPHAESRLSGFYGVENGWRWTKPQFSVNLGLPDSAGGTPWLTMKLYVPEASIRKLGPMTLSARVGPHMLAPETYAQPGKYTFERKLNADWFSRGVNRVDFTLDKWLKPSPGDSRELGIIVQETAVTLR
jgi:Dolichyl-phosphate-mannose-protein mannosyltransferase